MEKTTIYVFRTQAKAQGPDLWWYQNPNPYNVIDNSAFILSIHYTEMNFKGFFLLLLDMYQTLLRAFVRHPLQSIYYNVHVVTRIIYRRASKQI